MIARDINSIKAAAWMHVIRTWANRDFTRSASIKYSAKKKNGFTYEITLGR